MGIPLVVPVGADVRLGMLHVCVLFLPVGLLPVPVGMAVGVPVPMPVGVGVDVQWTLSLRSMTVPG